MREKEAKTNLSEKNLAAAMLTQELRISNNETKFEQPGSENYEKLQEVAVNVVFEDMTNQKNEEHVQGFLVRILKKINRMKIEKAMIKEILNDIKDFCGVEAAGIRLREGEDFPYFVNIGYPEGFVERDNFICSRAGGQVKLECICGSVLSENKTSCFSNRSSNGSFWTGDLKNSVFTSKEKPVHALRQHCNEAGFKSIALIPFRDESKVIGLIHLGDMRPQRFREFDIHFLEEIASSISVAIQRSQAHEEIRASEERFRAFFEQSAVSTADIETFSGQFIRVNKYFCDLLGYSSAELLNSNLIKLIHPDDQQVYLENLRLLTAGKTREFTVEARFLNKERGIVWTIVTISPLWEPNETPTHHLAIIQDISFRKGEEIEREIISQISQLFVTEKPIELIFPAVPNILAHAFNFPVVYIELFNETNQEMELIASVGLPENHGIPLRSPVSKSFFDIISLSTETLIGFKTDQVSEIKNNFLKKFGVETYFCFPLMSRQRFIGTLTFADQKKRDDVSFFLSSFKAVSNYLGEIIEWHQSRLAISKLNRFFEAILESDGVLVSVQDANQSYLFWNKGAEALTGYSRGEVLGSNKVLELMFPNPDDRREFVQVRSMVLAGEPCDNWQGQIQTKDGDQRTISFSSRCMSDSKGNPVGIINFGVDITLQKRVEAKLRQAEKKLLVAQAQEARVAEEIQATLLLGHPPKELEGADLSVVSYPSMHVDGDFYDFFQVHDHIFDLLIGDVMGKGVPAALIGAATRSVFLRAQSLLFGLTNSCLPSLESILTTVHGDLAKRLSDLNTFATLIFARFNFENRTFQVINCGHPPVFLHKKSSGKILAFPSIFAPMGLFNKAEYSSVTSNFDFGDRMLFFSDGVSDARNSAGDFFGEQRIRDILKTFSESTSQALLDHLYNEVKNFVGDEYLSDDFSCISVRIGEPGVSTPVFSEEVRFSLNTQIKQSFSGLLAELSKNSPYSSQEPIWLADFDKAIQTALYTIPRGLYSQNHDDTIHMLLQEYLDRMILRISLNGALYENELSSNLSRPSSIYPTNLFSRLSPFLDDVAFVRAKNNQFCLRLVKRFSNNAK